ncbi:MFS transporter [Saccharothrix saharensis]|uniref:MFS transporter n=1 Tax=Saccharothrix saharensis TaxID=571190 RepID=UPI003673EAF6
MRLRELHPNLRLRIAVAFVERALNTIITPLMAIYLAGQVGAARAGLLIGAAVVLAVVASLVGGPVADGRGRRLPLLVGTAGTAIAFLGMAAASSPWWGSAPAVFAFYVLNNAVSHFAVPANEAMIVDVTPTEHRKAVYTLQYWTVNAALAAGALVASFLYSGYFTAMLTVAAAIAGVAALVSLKYLTETMPEAVGRPRFRALLRGYADAVRNRPFLRLVAGMTLWLGLETQLVGYIGVHLAQTHPQRREWLALGPWHVHLNGVEVLGVLRAENTLLIVVLAAFSHRLARGLADRPRVLLGVALFAAGNATLVLAADLVVLVLAVLVLTIGELLHIPVMQAMLADLVPEHARTRYLAVFKLDIQGGLLISAAGISAGAVLPPWGMAVGFGVLAALIVTSYRPLLARRAVGSSA